jgi:hypothetical protein
MSPDSGPAISHGENMASAHLDHLVLAAHSLTQGTEYIRKKLGVELQDGGQHASQGTYNKLLKLNQGCYLEVIAIDPDGNRPSNPRWFNLDSQELNEKLLERPRLITWVARTDDIHSLAKLSKIDIGQVRPMSRGQLSWEMTFTSDGSLVLGGQVPPLIEWRSDQHPSNNLDESGCRLVKLEGFHSQAILVQEVVKSLGLEKEIQINPVDSGGEEKLKAHIETPAGIVVLD